MRNLSLHMSIYCIYLSFFLFVMLTICKLYTLLPTLPCGMQVDTINAAASPAGEGCHGGNVMKQQVTISILPPAPTRLIEKMATMATAAAATATTSIPVTYANQESVTHNTEPPPSTAAAAAEGSMLVQSRPAVTGTTTTTGTATPTTHCDDDDCEPTTIVPSAPVSLSYLLPDLCFCFDTLSGDSFSPSPFPTLT